MEGGILHALARKDVSRSTQKHGLSGNRHTKSLGIFLLPSFYPISLLLAASPSVVHGTAAHGSTLAWRKSSQQDLTH